MRFTILATAVAALASTALAQVSILTPGAGTVWVPGTNVTVKWAQPLLEDADIELLTGPNVQAQWIASTLGTAKKGSKSFKGLLDPKLEPQWYSLRIGEIYSHLFAIQQSRSATLTASQPIVPTATTTTAVATTVVTTTVATTITSPSQTTTTAGQSSPSNTPSAAKALKAGIVVPVAAAAVAAFFAF
ncbi:hypothetical protein BX616_010638 [Lobosporangium transversale]|uniref:Yeast cell wall synthesis Kre9/Knh1-like N-terminal domain-containing protein n=1 Tax=Lobosporangium transversale TaxID=64571 RepID=A0A1Y2G624_9FUNG|nr:hypothetical protein BCR41DRAFT_364758 [Lobosporangium transversale]KAF9917997.1 hypothetical protein BX616_010638 [Lobosporangium transversale]ORY96989.1 hypothetical protein BCR41DRAFT_364758 [Lobosporangium transversale]|eukprot:XP_021875551.1 hypothetical protein BCR41DRAFT_364758 [Lobosporangium transversale]